jgi:type IV pilus assembly protein PilP
MEKGGTNYALVQIDRLLYQVKPGQRIGQNFGIVTRVSDDAVNIREVVQDSAGEWVERMAKLELQSKETGK